MSALLYVLLLLLALPLALLLLLWLAPAPLLAVADRRVAKALDAESWNRDSPYAGPGFLPVHRELRHTPVEVEGTLPPDLDGVYLRNGTNGQFEQTTSRMHMFNGAGMLHQVQIAGGAATYSNTFVRTPRFDIEARAGAEVYPEFGDLAGGGKAAMGKIVLDRLKQRFGVIPAMETLRNTSSTTAIQYHEGKLYCLQETGYPFALQTREENGLLVLDGSGQLEDFGGAMEAPFTAHPKIDPASGDWYTFSTDFMHGLIRYAVLQKGRLEKVVELDRSRPALAFLHDYFLTEAHAVFPDLSLRFDPKGLMAENASPFHFDPNYRMRFGVIRRDHRAGDAVQWFTTDQPGHIWHTINAWEEARPDGGTDIVLFAPVFREYPGTVPIHTPLEPHAHLYKYRLNLDTGEVTEQRRLLDHFYERPSFNTAYLGKPSRYAYLLDEEGAGGVMAKGVLKYDLLDEREVGYFDYGDARGGEALFVARKGAEAEDDGYLLELLMTEAEASLVVIDAKTMVEVARLRLPQRVPYGVHSCWVDEAKLARMRHGP